MNEELTTQNPKPTSGRREAFIRFAAKASPAALLIAIGLDWVTPETPSHAANIAIASVGVLIIVAGLVLAIVALRSVRRYGRRGIRTPAIAGVIVNGAALLIGGVFVIALIPTMRAVDRVQNAGLTRAEMEALPEVLPGSRKIFNEAIGFRMEVPRDCNNNPDPLPANVLYSFLQPDEEKGNLVINVTRSRSHVQMPLSPQDIESIRKTFPPGAELQISPYPWGAEQLEVFTVQFPRKDVAVCAQFAIVPLCRETIQVAVTGLAPRKSESLELLHRLLDGLKGITYEQSVARARGVRTPQ